MLIRKNTLRRMRTRPSYYRLVAALLLLSPAPLTAQIRSLRPAWSAGDEVSLQILRTVEDPSLPGGRTSATSFVRLRVLEASAAGSRIEWTKRAAQTHQTVQSTGAGIQLQAVLDPDGHCVSIRNQPETSRADAADFALQEVEPYVRAGILALHRMPSPTEVVDRAIQELSMYLGFQGLALTNAPYHYEQPYSRPTALPSHPLTGTLQGEVSQAGPYEAASAVLVYYDPAVLSEAVEEMLRRPPFSTRSARVKDHAALSLVEKLEMKAKVARGFPDEFTWTRQLSEDGRWTVTEHVTFEVVEVSIRYPTQRGVLP